jgi:hypothetical protein
MTWSLLKYFLKYENLKEYSFWTYPSRHSKGIQEENSGVNDSGRNNHQ